MDYDTLAAARVGTTLCQKWTLEKLLGVGGMAAVYVANHKIGRRDAIKILHRDVAQQPDMLMRFEQEAHAVNRFQHPGAVEIRDIDVAEDGSPFLVMELLAGESLNERARRLGGVPLDEVLRLIDELLDVLASAHARGIIHRDIKLDNLFVQTDGRLKVLDFGIARIRDGMPLQMRTRAGATLGTAPYMPPEQIRGQEIDARADLFAVGATMFRLIAKRRIHEASTETEMLLKMASQPAPPLLSVAPETPPGVGLVVDRALRFDRDLRYPDALAMQADVRALRAGLPPPNAAAQMGQGPGPAAGAFSEEATVRPGQQQAAIDRTAATALNALVVAANGAMTPRIGSEASLPGYSALPSPQLLAASAPAPLSVDPVTQNRPGSLPLGPERTLKSADSLGKAVTMLASSSDGAPVPVLHRPMLASELGPMSTSVSMARGPVSAPVVSIVAPSPPKKSPIDKNVVIGILIGAVFLLLGVGITLAVALRHPGNTVSEDSDAAAAPTAEASAAPPSEDDGSTIGWGRIATTSKKPGATATPPPQMPGPPGGMAAQPVGPPPPIGPGKGKPKGHK